MATQFSPKSNLSRQNWPTRHAKPKSKLQLVQNFKFVKYENENLQLSTESKRTPWSCNSRGQTPSTAGVKNLKIVFCDYENENIQSSAESNRRRLFWDPGHATAKGRLPAGLLSAGLDWHTKRVCRIFKIKDRNNKTRGKLCRSL